MDIRKIENQIIYKEDKKNRISSLSREHLYPELADNPKSPAVNYRKGKGTAENLELIDDIRK